MVSKLKLHLLSETYNEARLHLKKAEETSNLDSNDDEVIKRRRRIKKVYSPGNSDSSDDNPILKIKKVNPNLPYPTPPHCTTRQSACTGDDEVTDVVVTNSTIESVPHHSVYFAQGTIFVSFHQNLFNIICTYTHKSVVFFLQSVLKAKLSKTPSTQLLNV